MSAKLEALPADLKNRYLVVKMSGDIDKETAHKLRLEFEKHSNGAAVFVNMQVDIEAIDLSNRDAVKKAEGMKKAAMLIEQKAEAYDAEHGSTDRSTGTREYPGDGAEHYNELMELADDLRRQAEGSETQ